MIRIHFPVAGVPRRRAVLGSPHGTRPVIRPAGDGGGLGRPVHGAIIVSRGVENVPSNERHKEIKRRRHRRKKVALFARKLAKATVSERAIIADKLRSLTPGGQVIIDRWDLEKR